jgi:hypothetical protein
MQRTARTQPTQITSLARCTLASLRPTGEISAHLGECWPLGMHRLLSRMAGHERTRERTPRADQGTKRERRGGLKELLPALLPLH